MLITIYDLANLDGIKGSSCDAITELLALALPSPIRASFSGSGAGMEGIDI